MESSSQLRPNGIHLMPARDGSPFFQCGERGNITGTWTGTGTGEDRDPFGTEGVTRPNSSEPNRSDEYRDVSMRSTNPSRFDAVHWLLDRSWQLLHLQIFIVSCIS